MVIQTKIWVGITISLLFLSFAAVAAYRVTQQLIDTSYWVAHTYKVERLLEAVVAQLDDAEVPLAAGRTRVFEKSETKSPEGIAANLAPPHEVGVAPGECLSAEDSA